VAKTVFVDTSAFYALLVADDAAHSAARRALERLDREQAALVTTSFVVHETVTLLQNRVGTSAVSRFRDDVMPMLDLVWIDEPLLARALAALVAAGSRLVSLTDWTSFEAMRLRGIVEAFAFDPHFARQGFRLVAGSG
jgi:predicted nucleic acid-binding protein